MQKCSARLLPRIRVGLHDLKRSHYDCVWDLANEIATPRQVGLAMTKRSGLLRASPVNWTTTSLNNLVFVVMVKIYNSPQVKRYGN